MPIRPCGRLWFGLGRSEAVVQLPLFSCAARAGPHEKRRPQPRRQFLLVMPPTRRDEATLLAKLDAFARESATHQSHDWTLTSPRNVLLFNFPPDATGFLLQPATWRCLESSFVDEEQHLHQGLADAWRPQGLLRG